jgi:hypothetical protein
MPNGGDSRVGRTTFRASEKRMMLRLLACGEGVGIVGAVIAHWWGGSELWKVFATAAITLFFGSLLGGVVTLLIADFDRRRVQRASEIDFITNVLSDLKAVYDRVDRGRTLIKARRSAKTYGEEMLGFIEARVKLQNVERALRTDERSGPILQVHNDVESMEQYMRALIDEYEEEYKTVSLAQSIYEAQMKHALEAVPRDYIMEGLPRNAPWERLEGLPRLKDFLLPLTVSERLIGELESQYLQSFLGPLDAASEQLRTALKAQLSA